jgi:hypothetical protein
MEQETKHGSERIHLSIPFIGIFALHHVDVATQATIVRVSFNSLYWDFCSASWNKKPNTVLKEYIFQFPLLGFLLCIRKKRMCHNMRRFDFQFPLLGFLLCIRT